MGDIRANILRFALLGIAVGGLSCAALAQGIVAPGAGSGNIGTPEQSQGPAPSPFLIEPEAQIQGDQIKRETFQSQPFGQNKNWDLDIGRFQPQVNQDPNQLADDLKENYSGMRLRLPFRGRTGE